MKITEFCGYFSVCSKKLLNLNASLNSKCLSRNLVIWPIINPFTTAVTNVPHPIPSNFMNPIKINDKCYSDRLDSLCSLLYSILEPTDEQQVELFKMFKQNIKNEEILYKCFAILHEEIKLRFQESLIDGCLFYILNGINHENPNIRFYSMKMLLNYGMAEVNFIYNFKKPLTKLAQKETDRENCLLLIDIFCQILKEVYKNRNNPEEKKPEKKEKGDQNNQDEIAKAQEEDLKYANSMIEEIVARNQGDEVFILIFASNVYDYLEDNYELYKILIRSLYSCSDNVFSFVFYEDELKDEWLLEKYYHTIFRNSVQFLKLEHLDKAWLFKAFSLMLEENQIEKLTDKDYEFLRYLTKDKIDENKAEVWRTSFNFSPLVIRDILDPEDPTNPNNPKKASMCLTILESFLVCPPIQKTLFDEWYEQLNKVFLELAKDRNAFNDIIQVIVPQMETWINNPDISPIVKDDIKKLMEVFHKDDQYRNDNQNYNLNIFF